MNRSMEKIVDPDGVAHKAIPSGSILIAKVFEMVLRANKKLTLINFAF